MLPTATVKATRDQEREAGHSLSLALTPRLMNWVDLENRKPRQCEPFLKGNVHIHILSFHTVKVHGLMHYIRASNKRNQGPGGVMRATLCRSMAEWS